MPLLLQETLEDGGLRDVNEWWNGLDDQSQGGLIELWDACVSRVALAPGSEETEMELRVIGTATDPDSDNFEGFWNHEFYDFLVNHEEFYFEEKKFHICTSQPEARRAIEAGLIPADHVCPLDAALCPMRFAVDKAGGRSLRLSVDFVPKVR